MRTVTMRELDAFSESLQEVRDTMNKLRPMLAAGSQIVGERDSVDGCGFGIKLGQVALDEKERVLKKCERAAFNFLGEGRRPDEDVNKFFERICAMPVDELLATQKKNGLRLDLVGGKGQR